MTERALQVMKTDRDEGASQAWRMLWRRIIRNRSIVLGAVVLDRDRPGFDFCPRDIGL